MMYLSAIRAQARAFLGKFIKNEQGVTAIEYAVVAAGIAVVVLAVFKAGGPVDQMLKNTFDQLKTKMQTVITGAGNSSSGS
ncbi:MULTISPECIES: Flp family type IVb pilin [unclassified Gilliamella]|uniref:Flp family type IVb pilin n=1 Tax=unclassified Gilliamella TaxID=2685620 RepID=UPI00130794A4|nr:MULTISPECIES: Flp family type IVb pilin [unclassified Gilliamella]MWP48310.1 Flp family type IVb pilin [Gilliamella sp. Lep-s35]MWP68230.1 Flp family type IVb pilin [Gilliamella sp. Lep-s5]MWP76450.1 Flp family type IVb pilin [Gilliamella sp. Lep-s21]